MDGKISEFAGSALYSLTYKIGYNEEKLRYILSHFREQYYKRKELDKKGKKRIISSPSKNLLKLQRLILAYISKKTLFPETFHGYKKKRSNLTNARCHLNKRVITKLDIKDFFPSVHFKKVLALFGSLGFNEQESKILSRLTTADYCLPHGFSTSPTLAALMLINLDKRLKTLFMKIGLDYTYTFFSDDITISGNKGIKTLKKLICKIFRQEGFIVNESKIKEQNFWEKQEVTGISVNEKLNVPYDYRHNLRAIVHNCITLGPRTQIDRFNSEFCLDRKLDLSLSKFRERIFGKINYIKPINRELYNQLLAYFNKINWRTNNPVSVLV
ncbi:MAG: reverse transcriptase family protein [Candidatus Omnitrophica bacterium]|nr:reverse transcriptase family protein [Candidatus Omnitrophota bacterium]MCG2707911.1 reverse transcriptase family protein [Candidatus Omnitrophota bacterium]